MLVVAGFQPYSWMRGITYLRPLAYWCCGLLALFVDGLGYLFTAYLLPFTTEEHLPLRNLPEAQISNDLPLNNIYH